MYRRITVLTLCFMMVVLGAIPVFANNTAEGGGECEHKWDDIWWTETYPTCTTEGKEYSDCKNWCGERIYRTIPKTDHDWDYNYPTKYKKSDKNYHYYSEYNCWECDGEKWIKQKHSYKYSSTIKAATPKAKGKIVEKCACGLTRTKTVKWKRGAYGCTNYDFTHSIVYEGSKYITIKMKNAMKGSVVKVKIGKKTYKKKIKSSKKKIKIRIKNQKTANKITAGVYYKGKLIGKNLNKGEEKRVWYSTRVDIGMNKTQVRYTWGVPARKHSRSGGWDFWHWSDGSYVGFKSGKVAVWYDSEGNN